tara:strand:- start:378 stop:1283 length:906 start_codon:yes stop_codon:yes gene_type:complete
MNKNKLKNIAGLTLIEMMIGVIITSIIMAAMYTTYSVVNKTYSQVTDRAKISRSGRDIIEMLMRDVRMSGFTYFLGINDRSYPTETYLEFLGGDVAPIDSHDPLIIIKNQLGHARLPAGSAPTPVTKWDAADMCCDKIHIVYDDFNQNDATQPYKRYKVTYYAIPTSEGTDQRYAVYKAKESWKQPLTSNTGTWDSNCSECYSELIRDHVVDMEFIPFDQEGRVLLNSNSAGDKMDVMNLYKIRTVDIRLTFRSHKEFYRTEARAAKPREVKGLGDRSRDYQDKFLRDSVVVTVHTRNIGT